jgi:hypothetical protein
VITGNYTSDYNGDYRRLPAIASDYRQLPAITGDYTGYYTGDYTGDFRRLPAITPAITPLITPLITLVINRDYWQLPATKWETDNPAREQDGPTDLAWDLGA